MKANEFVREYGWDEAKKLIDSVKLQVLVNGIDCVPCFVLGDGKYLGYDELKRLVESWELVESLNGLIGAKACIREVYEDHPHDYMNRKLYDFDVKCCVVSRAIKDVESCQ